MVDYRAVGTVGAGGPPGFGRLVNPITTMVGRLCRPHYYSPPWIFRPSYGPFTSVLDSRIMSLDSDPRSQHFVSLCQVPYLVATCSRTGLHTDPKLKKPQVDTM